MLPYSSLHGNMVPAMLGGLAITFWQHEKYRKPGNTISKRQKPGAILSMENMSLLPEGS